MACLVVESPTQCSPLQTPYRPENRSLFENWFEKEGLQADSGYDSVLKVVEVDDSTCILNDASSESRVERGNETGISFQDPEDVCTLSSEIKGDQLGFVKNKIKQEHKDLVPVCEDVADHCKEHIFTELTIPLVKLRVVRNPLHKKLELEEDEYIFCNQCNKLCIGECAQHRVLKWLKVSPVVMKREGVSMARCTLFCNLELKESSIPDAGLGIFVKERFDSDTVFGPYGGKKISVSQVALNMDQSYMWDIIENGRVTHVVDARDEEHSNWLRFVNCARNEGEQNLVAFQYRGDIYYRSYKIIEPGNELLVWYGDRYACDLDILNGHMAMQSADGPVQCQKCFMWCPGPASLASHNKFRCRMNSEHYRWRCMHCDKSFKSYQQLNIHKNIHKGLKPYVCKICKKAFSCPSYRRKHYSIHVDGQSCQCEKCGKVFRTRSYLRKHEREFHGDNKEVKCPRCWKKCSGGRALRLHLRRCYSNGKSLRCIQCHKQYANRKSLKMHRQSIHSGDVFNCKTCGKMFQKKENLLKHESLHGNGMSQIRETHLKCAPCKMTFATIGHLRRHQEARHSGVAFNCKTCGKFFQKEETLRKHESLHEDEMTQERQTQIRCVPCRKTFTNLGHLRVHREHIHTCKICGKVILRKENLSRHEALHTGIKGRFSGDELTCEYCGKRYSCRKNLLAHRRNFHEMGWIRGKQINKKSFINRESLLNNGREWKCASCNKQFASKNRLRLHHLFAHKQDPSSGKTTGKLAQEKTKEGKLPKGKPTIGHKRRYDCDECGSSFSSGIGLSNHCRIHVDKKRHDLILRQCVKCKTHFKTSHSLQNHYRMYHPKLRSTRPKGYSADDRCLVCRLCFSNPYNLARHLRKQHPSLKILRCSLCPKVFVDEDHLTRHTAGHNNEGGTVNTSCNERVRRDSQNKKRSRFTCSICKKGFSSDFMMRLHKRSHYKAKAKQRYRCKICTSSFTDPVSLSLHKKRRCKRATSDTVQAIPTDNCTYMASCSHKDDEVHETTSASVNPPTGTNISHNTPGTLGKLDHRNDQAPNLCFPSKSSSRTPAKFSCDICGKVFSSSLSVQCHRACHFRKTNLQLSSETTSPTTPMLGDENNKFTCALCNKSFRKRKSLSVHMSHHSRAALHSKRGFARSPGKVSSARVPFMAAGEGFGCEFCSKAFTTKHSLNAHKSHHSRHCTKYTKGMRRPAVPGLRCEVCSKTFKSKNSLITHKVHHSRNAYTCSHCSTGSFKSQSALEEHMQSCSKPVEDRPYFCQYCEKRFYCYSGLYRHRLRKHPEHAGSRKHIEKHHDVVNTFREPHYETFIFQRKRFLTTGGRWEPTKVVGAEITPIPAQTEDVIGQQCGVALISEGRSNRGMEITSLRHGITGEEEQSSIKNKTSNSKRRNLKASWLDPNKQTANGFHCSYCHKGFSTMRSRYKHVMVVHAQDFGSHTTTSAHKSDSFCHPKVAPLDHYNSTQTTREENQTLQGFSCDLKVSDKFKKRGNGLIYVFSRKLCKFCRKGFDSASSLNHHVQTVHSNRIGRHIDSASLLHTPANTENERTVEHNDLESMVRPESSSRGQPLGDPVNAAVTSRVPRRKARQCEFCLRNFSTVGNRNKHVKTVHKLGHDKMTNNKVKKQRSELQSSLCNPTHSVRTEISSSIKSGVQGLKAFKCERCGKGFFTLNSRYKHFMLAHSKVPTSDN